MRSFEESLASWSTVVGTLLTFFGLFQSRAWLAVLGVLFASSSIVAFTYARKERIALQSAQVQVEGRRIDSLNVANLARRRNRSLVVQEAYHMARIEGEDLEIEWRYSGYCRAARETAIEFSVDADTSIPFSDLRCFAYDLRHDPNGDHRIRPLLVGADGISKKIAVPFLKPVMAQEAYSVMLKCQLPGCMKAEMEYYTSTLSFEQDLVPLFSVRLVFADKRPSWVRVYECGASGYPRLLRDLQPLRGHGHVVEYLDVAEDADARSARIYVFSRQRH